MFVSAAEGDGDVCAAPGVTVIEDAAGDVDIQGTAPAPVPVDTYDLLSLQVAQPPQDDGVNRLVFTFKTAALSTLPPVASWYTSFKGENGNLYGVRMNTDPSGAAAFQSYTVAGSLDAGDGAAVDGRFADVVTPAEAASNYSADGTITIVVKASDIGASRTGEIKQFNAGTVQRVGEESIGGAAFVMDAAPDDLSRHGSGSLADDGSNCGGSKSRLEKFGGALNAALLLPLGGLALWRRRRS